MELEAYLRTLWTFVQKAHHGLVPGFSFENKALVPYLWLSDSGAWKILAAPPEPQTPEALAGLTIPLVLPLVLIILVAHVETQWERRQSQVVLALA